MIFKTKYNKTSSKITYYDDECLEDENNSELVEETKFDPFIKPNDKAFKLTDHKGLDLQKDWVKFVVPDKYFYELVSRKDFENDWEYNYAVKKNKKKLNMNDKIIEKFKSYENKVTHTGLIYYLNYCWAKEIGASVRPDMIWYTVVSEVARQVVENPDTFKHLFSDKSEKVQLVTLSDCNYEINMNSVDSLLDENILNKDFKNLITNTKFDSQADNFDLAIKISFAYMASPYFDYMTSMCGIPHVEIVGEKNEYELLYSRIAELKKYVPEFEEYLNGCLEVVNDLLYWCFADNFERKPILPKDFHNRPVICENVESFLSNLFYVRMNCESGHEYDACGWATRLYMNQHEYLSQYPVHLKYIPYEHIDDKTCYYKAIGLTYSEYDEQAHILRPQYGYTIHQILDRQLFECLKN